MPFTNLIPDVFEVFFGNTYFVSEEVNPLPWHWHSVSVTFCWRSGIMFKILGGYAFKWQCSKYYWNGYVFRNTLQDFGEMFLNILGSFISFELEVARYRIHHHFKAKKSREAMFWCVIRTGFVLIKHFTPCSEVICLKRDKSTKFHF